MTRQDSKREIELVSLVRGYGVPVITGRHVPCGIKSNGQTRHCAPDLVIWDQKVAAFFDGCYWHRCAEHGPDDAEAARIRAKDADIAAELIARGWLVIRAWEHDDVKKSAERILEAVRERHRSMKSIHRIPAPKPHRRLRGDWCEHCAEEPHAAKPDEAGRWCDACGDLIEDHDDTAIRLILEQAEALADDIKLISIRHGDVGDVRRSEMRELAAAAKRFSRQVGFLEAGEQA